MVRTVNFSVQTVLPDSESILDSFLQNEYPQKYKEIQFASLWSSTEQKTTNDWQMKKRMLDLSKFLKVLSGNNPIYVAHLLKFFLRANVLVKNNFEEAKDCDLIV